PTMGLLEERRIIYEREARAFAAELLMPFFEVRKRWFAISQERPVEGELSVESRIERLATEFGVTPAAMRVRLQQTKLIPSSCLQSASSPSRAMAAGSISAASQL